MASIGCSPVIAGAHNLAIKTRVGQMHKERKKKREQSKLFMLNVLNRKFYDDKGFGLVFRI